MRGTFANIRLRNLLVPGVEGGWTVHLPSGSDDDLRRRDALPDGRVPLVVVAGKEYGTGSSRDWAAKGTLLLGVRVVIAESYERIHAATWSAWAYAARVPARRVARRRTASRARRRSTSRGSRDGLAPGKRVTVRAQAADGATETFEAVARVDTPDDVAYYRHGGLLPYVLRGMLRARRPGINEPTLRALLDVARRGGARRRPADARATSTPASPYEWKADDSPVTDGRPRVRGRDAARDRPRVPRSRHPRRGGG